MPKTTKDTQPAKSEHSIEPLTDSEYEKIGRVMESVVTHGYAGKRRLFGMNFLRGVFFGFGSTIGATLLIVIIIYSLSLFSEFPLIGDLFESIQQTVEQTTPGSP